MRTLTAEAILTAHPIIFSDAMVRAILAGRKTQTRRILTSRGHHPFEGTFDEEGHPEAPWKGSGCRLARILCPYGDRLWVRETWAGDDCCGFVYRADHPNADLRRGDLDDGEQSIRCWRSPILMPRRASRLLLEVTGVRVERLQDLTDEDAIAEGITDPDSADSYSHTAARLGIAPGALTAKEAFAIGWDLLNGKRAPWASNPFCWVISFKRGDPSSRRFGDVIGAGPARTPPN